MDKKLIIIDGSSILSTSFYGTVPVLYYSKKEEDKKKAISSLLKTSRGEYINGVFTALKIILKVISKQKPTHLAVVWDRSRDTFRRKLYKEYKGNRQETPEELKMQFPIMQEILSQMGIKQFIDENYEADDFAGSVAKQFEKEIPTFILSKDQDLLQLVNPYTRVWLITSKAKEMYESVGLNIKDLNIPDNAFEFTPLYVKEFYGLEPIQIIDKKALEGEKTDNIPGVNGVGAKAVIPLLQEYKTVENIYRMIEGLNEKEEEEMKKFLKEVLGISRSPIPLLLKTSETELVGKEAALLSKQLATIKTDINEVKDTVLEDFILNVDEENKISIFKKYEFNSLIGEKVEEAKANKTTKTPFIATKKEQKKEIKPVAPVYEQLSLI